MTMEKTSASLSSRHPYALASSVGEALFSQFRDYANRAIVNGDIMSNAVYEKAIEGLQVAAPQAGDFILDKLLAWRTETLSHVGLEPPGPISVLHKRLIVESFFLEATFQIFNASASVATRHQLNEVQTLAFDWVINGEKYVDIRNSSLYGVRDKIMNSAARLLGSISEVNLDTITERFLSEISLKIKAEANSISRQELYSLCHGLRFVRIKGDDLQQIFSAIKFLEAVFPLRHVAPDKKSRLQQAITEMMTSVLTPLVDEGDPDHFVSNYDNEIQRKWYNIISLLRSELTKWTIKQSKQAHAGLPAITVLTCLLRREDFLSEIDQLIDILHRNLKDKKNVSVVLLCIVRCVKCFYFRMGRKGSLENSDAAFMVRWTHKVTSPIVQSALKGQLSTFEQLDLLRKLVTVVTNHLPEYGVRNIILELLAIDGVQQPWEATMAGLMSVMSILVEAPGRFAGQRLNIKLPETATALDESMAATPTLSGNHYQVKIGFGGTPWSPDQIACEQLLEVVKHSHNPLEAYGISSFMPLISTAVGKILQQCHQLHGYTRLTNAARPSTEVSTSQKMSALSIFIATLQLIPFIIPDQWLNNSIKEDLPGYIIHAEPSVRRVAIDACKRCMLALPASREAIVFCLTKFTVHLQEDHIDIIRNNLELLVDLTSNWNQIAISERRLADMAGKSAASPAIRGTFTNFSDMEGTVFVMLCALDVQIRKLAIKLLEQVRTLHRTVTLTSQQAHLWSSTDRTMDESRGESHRFRTSFPASYNNDDLEDIVDGDSVPILSLPPNLRRVNVSSTQASAHHARRSTYGSIASLPTVSSNTSRALPTPTLGDNCASFKTLQDDGDDIFYVADVIERFGDSITQKYYWDFGPWGDIWREWRALPEDNYNFMDCLSRLRTNEDSIRWSRILCELCKELFIRCEQSAFVLHKEIVSKLLALASLDSSGRQSLPTDGSRGELARNYVLCGAASPLFDSVRSKEQRLDSLDFVRLLISSARTTNVDCSAVLGLGYINPSCHIIVVREVSSLLKENTSSTGAASGTGTVGGSRSGPTGGLAGSMKSSRSGGPKREEVRLFQAHVFRIVASNLLPGSLIENTALRECLVEFVAETSRFITVTVDVSPELQQLRFCLCSVSRACAYQLAVSQPQYFPSMLRKQLFDKFSLYCEDGRTPGLFRSELKRHISAAKAAMKGRDADLLHHLETDIVDASEMLEHAAYLGMASMLAGNAFDVNSRDPKGRVFLWVNRMLTPRDESGIPIQAKRYKQYHVYIPGQVNIRLGKTDEENHGAAAWGPPKTYTAHIALRNLLNSNTDLGGIFADHSYSSNQQIGTTYFLVLAEIYNSMSIEIEEHIVVSLLLQKIIDPLLEVRDAAQAMFRTMVKRHKMHVIESENDPMNTRIDKSLLTGFVEGKPEEIVSRSRSNEQMAESFEGAVVVGCLPESHQAFQQHISSILAREHAELSHNVVREVLMRQQQCIVNKSGYDLIDKVLLCLQPWFEYAAFHRGWEGQWNVDILQGMYSITSSLQKSNQRLMSIQKLWMTVLSNRRNTFPVIDFLLRQGVAATAEASLKIEKGDLSLASAMDVVLEPGKNVALYLSRVAPRQVIDLLVYEAALQLTESEGLSSKNSSYLLEQQQHFHDVNASDAPKKDQEKRMNEHIRIKEFHHKPALAPLQAPLPHQQPLAAHAAAAVAAATSGASKALTPASIALAIKRSTIDLVIKTGAAVADTVAVAGAAAVGTFAAQGLGSPDTMPAGLPRQTKYFEDSSRHQVDFIQSQGKYYNLGEGSVNIDDKEQNKISAGLISASTPEPPKTRLALNRPEVALCLLSEIVCEKDEEFRTHLSQLLHVAVLHIDSINPTVRLEAFQILQYLLYSLSYKQLENDYLGHSPAHNVNQQGFGHQGNQSNDFSADFARVSGVIEYLQSMSGEALWKWELPTLTQPWIKSAGYVAAFVQIVADCFPFDTSLREKWSDEALKWSCCAASRHGASRSHQVFCALGPSLNSKASTALLAALAKCLNNATVEGLDTAVEILCTLRVLLDNTPSNKIPLYPHLFAACIALLNSSVVRIGELAYALLLQLLANLDLSSPAIQQNILSVLPLDFWDDCGNFDMVDDLNKSKIEFASDIINLSDSFSSRKNVNGPLDDLSPPAWLLGEGLLGGVPEIEDDVTAGGPWLALQQLLVKGLLQAETLILSLKAMAAIARQISSALAHKSHFFTQETYSKMETCYGESVGNQHENIRTGVMKPADLSYGSKEIANYSGGIEDILGSTEVGMVISIAAALPWICVHLANDDHIADACREFLHEISVPLEFIQCEELACMLSVLSDDTPEEIVMSGYITWLPDLMEVICKSFFPKYARLVVQRLMETISRAGLQYQEAALTILQCIFEVPDVNLGPSSWFSHDNHLVDSLSHDVGGPLTLQVLALLEAMARFQDLNLSKDSLEEEALTEPARLLEWPFCIDDLGESNKVCSEALRRVVESCPGIEGLANAISLPLPNSLNREGDDLSGAQDVQLGTSSGEQLLPFLQLSPSLT